LLRGFIELAFVFLSYQLFAKQILGIIPILLLGTVFALNIAAASITFTSFRRKEPKDKTV
jgi:hypothetical protein